MVDLKRKIIGRQILQETAEVFDLPAELAGRLLHLEVCGNGKLYLENHHGILSYSGEEIAVNGEDMVVRIIGKGLELESMTASALRIVGTIERIEWVE